MGNSGDADMDAAVTDATMLEAEKVWLRDPLTEAQLDELYGLWFPVRRFGIRQGEGYRVIDDYTEIDVVGADVLDEHGWVFIKLSTGKVKSGFLHPSLSASMAKSLVGKFETWRKHTASLLETLSMAPSPLSQCGTVGGKLWSSASSWFFHLVLWGPSGFKGVERSFWLLLIEGLGILGTHTLTTSWSSLWKL